MKRTRFMELMFSNTDEELAAQVKSDIDHANCEGCTDTDELRYDKIGNSDAVAITDKETGEVTVAEPTEDPETYDLTAVESPSSQLEGWVHPQRDGVSRGSQRGALDEDIRSHLSGGSVIIPGGSNSRSAWEIATDSPYYQACGISGEASKNFSAFETNGAIQKIFSMDQVMMEKVFAEVVESSETARVGDLKIERCGDDESSVIVTSESTGDQAKVTLDDDEMQVTELDSKNFSVDTYSSHQYLPLHVVGVHPYDHIIIDGQEYTRVGANRLKARLEEDGVESVQIFDNSDDARDYAAELLSWLDADSADTSPTEERKYSEYVGSPVYSYGYSTDSSVFMSRLFSEQEVGLSQLKDSVEAAIKGGKEIEDDFNIITPVDATTAVIEDKSGDEFTKAQLSGEDMILEKIDSDEADDLCDGLSTLQVDADRDDDDDEDDDDEENCYSDVYCNEDGTKFFSETEEMTDYMIRLYSEEEDEESSTVEAAIESGKEVETDSETITPVDDSTAVIEDKESGEYTKATIVDDSRMIVHPISPSEAEDLLEDIEVDEDSEKTYTEIGDILCDDSETRFFSAGEYFTDYMERLYNDESDEDVISGAIEDGKEVENDTEIITPVDDKTAVVEDKDSGEYTKATLDEDGDLDTEAISDDEADELLEDIEVDEDSEKTYTEIGDILCDYSETRFFSAGEYFTAYMERLYSDPEEQQILEDAIESGKQAEDEDQIITPVDDKTAVVEDKETGEYTKATLSDEIVETEPISEEEAEDLLEDVKVGPGEVVDDEKKYADVFCDVSRTRYFSEGEVMTQYMCRLYSGRSDEELIEGAIEDGKEVENDTEIITPVDDKTAVVEDKENGEYTKATLDDDEIDLKPISSEEASDLLEDVSVEQTEEDEAEEEFDKKFSAMGRFFAEVAASQPAAPAQPAVNTAAAPVDQNGNPIDPNTGNPIEEDGTPSVEEIEDKAAAAVAQIQAAAEAAAAQIAQAKAEPAPTSEPEIQEAQFSQRTFSYGDTNPVISWLSNRI